MTLYPHPRRFDSKPYLAFVRRLPCSVSDCRGRSEAHHVRLAGQGSIGLKTDDTQAVPLCHIHHMAYHNVGRVAFEKEHGLDMSREIIRTLTQYLRELSG